MLRRCGRVASSGARIAQSGIWRSFLSALRCPGVAPAVVAAGVLGALLLPGATFQHWGAYAQTVAPVPAACPAQGEAAPAGHRISCVLGEDDSGDVEIDARGVTIEAGERGVGVEGRHDGGGDVSIAVSGSRVTTLGHWTETEAAHGIVAAALNGSVEVTLRDVDIETLGTSVDDPADPDAETSAVGVYAEREEGAGTVALDVSGGRIATRGRGSHGILASGAGDMAMRVRGTTVTTNGDLSDGLAGYVLEGDEGSVDIEIRDAGVITHGEGADGVVGGLSNGSSGSVELDLEGTTVSTGGDSGYGLYGVISGGSEGRLEIDIRDSAITTGGRGSFGVGGAALQESRGEVGIRVRDASVATRGELSHGVFGIVEGESAGDVGIDVDGGAVSTQGEGADALVGLVRGGSMGDVGIEVHDTTVTTNGRGADGLTGLIAGGSRGSVEIGVRGATVSTSGERSHGLRGIVDDGSEGDVGIDVGDTTVTTMSDLSDGVAGWVSGGSEGSVHVAVRDSAITVSGRGSDGVYAAVHGGSQGDVEIELRNVDVESRSTALDEHGDTFSNGVAAVTGQFDGSEGEFASSLSIGTAGGSIVTRGVLSRGIQAIHLPGEGANRGDIRIATAGTRIETRGADADGILVYHTGEGRIDVRVDGGRIDALGQGSNGIRIGQAAAAGIRSGRTGPAGTVERSAPVGADGYRRQTVTIDAPVTGGTGLAAGVFLAGGGRVVVGPRGRLGAGSGIAVFAVGETEVAGQQIPRRLRVDLLPDGRPPSDLLDGVIRNDGGETVLTVNGVALFDSADGGPTRSWAPNGARDVTLADGLAGLDFSRSESFVDRYAPRAAVYEALPGFLMRLDGRLTGGKRLRQAGTPAWVAFSGGVGSYGADRASVGASYEFDRFGTEAGLDFPLNSAGELRGWASVRYVRGSAVVAAGTGGGRIEAAGIGASLGASWSDDGGYYADGRISATRYEASMNADGRGRLTQDAASTVRGLRLEGGRRVGLGDSMQVMPRAWLAGSEVAMSGFVDAVGTRVSLADGARFAAGVGIAAEAVQAWQGGERMLSVQGELGVERTLGDARTGVDVSGERLVSGPPRNRAMLGLSAVYRWSGYSVGGEVTALGPGSDDSEFAGSLRLGMRF